MSLMNDIRFAVVPSIDRTNSIVVLIANILIPGLGTLYGGIVGKHENSRWVGLIQLFLLLFVATGIIYLLDLIWAVFLGVRFVSKSHRKSYVNSKLSYGTTPNGYGVTETKTTYTTTNPQYTYPTTDVTATKTTSYTTTGPFYTTATA